MDLRCNLACPCPSRIKPLLAASVSAVGMWATRLRCPSEAAYPQPSPPPRFCPCRRATPPSASGCSSPGAGAESCRTRRHNAHELGEREVLYPFHPWSGCLVRVREARERTSGDIFRCTIGRDDGDRGRDLPAWMFDRAICGLVRMSGSPVADMAALVKLRALLNDALGLGRPEAAASIGAHSGASMGSHDPNRREAHARTTNAASQPPTSGTASVRSLRRRAKGRSRGPEWKALPEAARQEVMTALTRLMLDHGRQHGLQGREARHDD